MASFNKVIILGNLTRDPEVRYTPKGSAVCDLGIAVNRVYTLDNGEKRAFLPRGLGTTARRFRICAALACDDDRARRS